MSFMAFVSRKYHMPALNHLFHWVISVTGTIRPSLYGKLPCDIFDISYARAQIDFERSHTECQIIFCLTMLLYAQARLSVLCWTLVTRVIIIKSSVESARRGLKLNTNREKHKISESSRITRDTSELPFRKRNILQNCLIRKF